VEFAASLNVKSGARGQRLSEYSVPG